MKSPNQFPERGFSATCTGEAHVAICMCRARKVLRERILHQQTPVVNLAYQDRLFSGVSGTKPVEPGSTTLLRMADFVTVACGGFGRTGTNGVVTSSRPTPCRATTGTKVPNVDRESGAAKSSKEPDPTGSPGDLEPPEPDWPPPATATVRTSPVVVYHTGKGGNCGRKVNGRTE